LLLEEEDEEKAEIWNIQLMKSHTNIFCQSWMLWIIINMIQRSC